MMREYRLSPGGYPQAIATADSCGGDVWNHPLTVAWLCRFMRASPAVLEIRTHSGQAHIPCLSRHLPLGYRLLSAQPYASIQGDAGLFWDGGGDLARYLRRHRVVRMELAFSGPCLRDCPGSFAGHQLLRAAPELDAVRQVIDLAPAQRDPAWLESCLGSKIRWAVRKARREGCTVRAAGDADVDAVQDLYARTMRAKGAPVNYPRERFAGLLRELAPEGMGRLYIGHIDDRPAGMAALVQGGSSAHLIQLAVPPEYQSRRLSELLIHRCLEDTIVAGRRYFDFMASQAGDHGLIAFKAKWGGDTEAIRHIVLASDPLLSPGIDLVRRLNRLRGKLRVA